MELKQVVCENTLIIYIEGLVNDYIQKEIFGIHEEPVRKYMTVFNLVVRFNTILQNKNLATRIRIFSETYKFVNVEFKYFNVGLMYSKAEKIAFANDIYDLAIHCSKQDFTKHLKPFTIKKRCEKQDCDGCKCEK
jgi:hypothetical protein